MNDNDMTFIKSLLYSTDTEYVMNELMNMNNPLIPHYFAANYNWDNGFELPVVILENAACDVGTGLLLFHYADGYRFLVEIDEPSSEPMEEWNFFMKRVYEKLLSLDFTSQDISFDPGLTKVQV
ncbi:DUF4274 domain-containing protein [Rossellomorea vietnamensis]|uniref:DUF4274 domain-containing protein n=1 Tax=Rossellomorea vietnamensis TaxID=218284 RepID=UPI001E5EE561|nr:DUF4274 domain-containing protein [Rossellomorea vietnamensis]MCC5804349.1 DUF4274 domain-containing protein [Rossellomorea vietnamensis]